MITNKAIQLTPAQKEAVYSPDRFIAVVAGPGSGKTRVLTERICHLVRDCNVDFRRILAVSFSTKAAGELTKRLKDSIGNMAIENGARTFHSFGLSLIREYADRLGYKDNPEVITSTDRNRIIRKIWETKKKKEKDFYYSHS